MASIGFIVYFFVLLALLWSINKKISAGLGFAQLAVAFFFHILLGCAYGYIFHEYYRGDDTWMFHRESLAQYQRLVGQPLDFFRDLLPMAHYKKSHSAIQYFQFYLEDLQYYGITKSLAVFDLFSRGHYYINILFFNFLTLSGSLLLYKRLRTAFADRGTILYIFIFFLPLPAFWLSGIRTEGLLFFWFTLLIYAFTSEKHISVGKFILTVFALLCCFALRLWFTILLLPALMGLVASLRWPSRSLRIFSGIYIISVALFFLGMVVSPASNLSVPVINRQKEFFSLQGNTRFPLDSLTNSPASFLKEFPKAAMNVGIRPLPWHAAGFLQLATSLDNLFLVVTLLLLFQFPSKDWNKRIRNPIILLFIGFGLSQLLFIGYVVPFPGAIVRYKSIAELMLFLSIGLLGDFCQILKPFKKEREV